MGDSSEKDASAFEFNEEEELTEATAEQLMEKFHSKNQDLPPDKYRFLRHYSDMKQTTVGSVMCIDIHEADGVAPLYASSLTEENIAYSIQRTKSNGLGISSSFDDHDHLSSAGIGVNTDSDREEDNWNSQSEPSSSRCSDIPENDDYMEGPSSDDYSSPHREMNEVEGEVSFRPDFITCGPTLYLEPLLIFSPDGIKLDTTDSGYDEEISMEWKISDVIYIKCKWTGSAESVSMRILLQADHVGCSKSERYVKVSFVVSGMHFREKEYKIRNLASRYEEIWNAAPLDDTDSDGNGVDSTLFFPKHYFFEIAQNFEDVIYPKGDPDAVSISKRDVELLLPETFVNDTIIDFYIKYLYNGIPDNMKQRFHFFNSFFFRKLADLDKDPGKTPEGRAAFLRVRKWTRKLNVFDKDFIFIPVNFNLHWSLLVICHPGEIVKLRDDGVIGSPKVPCILHMDSLKGSHSGLKNIIQSYLWEEWKERHPELTESTEDNSSRFLNLRFVSLELPQQENSYDCGLFLLHYVERFLDDASFEVSPFTITKFSSFLTPEWFPPAEASFKRSLIRMLIYNLIHETGQKAGTTTSKGTNGYSQNSEIELEQEAGVELLAKPFCSTEAVVSPVFPVVSSVCRVNETRNGSDNDHMVGKGEDVQKEVFDDVSECCENTHDPTRMVERETCIRVLCRKVFENVSECCEDTSESTQMVERETCILVDEEEEKRSSVVRIEEDKEPTDGYHGCEPSLNHVISKSPVACDLAITDSVLDTDGVPEDSSKRDQDTKDPASPLPNSSEYVPDTPIMSLFEITDKDDGERGEKPTVEQISNPPKTPIISSIAVRKPNQLQNENIEYVPDTPDICYSMEVIPNKNCEKVEKSVLAETDHCGYVSESSMLCPDRLGDKEADCTETEQVDMEIDGTADKVLYGEKERSASTVVDIGAAKAESTTVPVEDNVISDKYDEGSIGTTDEVLNGEKEGSASTIVDIGANKAESTTVPVEDNVISDKYEEGSIGMTDKILTGEKEGSASIIVDIGASKAESTTVPVEDNVISDKYDEGSIGTTDEVLNGEKEGSASTIVDVGANKAESTTVPVEDNVISDKYEEGSIGMTDEILTGEKEGSASIIVDIGANKAESTTVPAEDKVISDKCEEGSIGTTDEVLNREKEGSASIIVDIGANKAESTTVPAEDKVISDKCEEGSLDEDQVKEKKASKKRRRAVVFPEGSERRVTRSSLRGSTS